MRAVLSASNDCIEVYDCFDARDYIKTIRGRRWDSVRKVWVLPLTLEAVDALSGLFGSIDKRIKAWANSQRATRNAVEAKRLAEKAEAREPMPIKATPYQHQIKAYNMACEWFGFFKGSTKGGSGFAFLMEMGCGKSITTIATIGRGYLAGKIKRVLIAAPTSILPVWVEELRKFADFPVSAIVLSGGTKERYAAIKRGHPMYAKDCVQVFIINYEAIWRELEIGAGKVDSIDNALRQWGPDMIVCDESQRIKTHNANQSKAMHKLGDITPYKLILTGTPVQNNPLDFWSQYRFIDKTVFGTSFYAFKNRYAITGGYNNKQVIGYVKLDELTAKAHSIAYRVTKAEALDLPEYTDQTLFVDLEPSTKRLYRQLADEAYAELDRGEVTVTNVLTKLLRLMQITGGFLGVTETDDAQGIVTTVIRQVSSAKMDALSDLIEDIVDSGKKVVVFAHFLPEIQEIEKRLQKMKLDYGIIYGAIKDRGEQVDKFQTDPACKVFIAQIATAGLGITLTAADTVVFYSLDFNYAYYEQARARIHRIGQKNACTYIHLIAPGTVDEKVMQALAAKEDMAKKVVDNWRELFT